MTAARRGLLPAVVLLTLALALAGAATAPLPSRLPAVALGAVVVWRVEVASVVFAALYAVLVVARLALHGETLTRVGRDGIEIPRVGAVRGAEGPVADQAAVDAKQLDRLAATLGARDESDDPTHPLLRSDEEDT